VADPKNRLSLSRPLSRLHGNAPAATPMAARGVGREIRINESGIEQTVVAFDVTVKASDISAGSGGLLATP